MDFNPFDLQRQMLAEYEKAMGELLEKTMRDPAFMRLVAQSMGSALDMQALTRTQIEAVLESLQLPTPEMVEKLYDTIHRLESRVLDLEEQVEDLQTARPTGHGESQADLRGEHARPPRTAIVRAKKVAIKATSGGPETRK